MQSHTTPTRPPLDSLACVNEACELYGQAGQNNLIVRKRYGADQVRYLRCRQCREEFSERKGTALWNSKKPEATAVAIAAQVSEGSSISATARLCAVDPSTVERLNRKLGEHAQAFHEAHAQDLDIQTLEGDERHGFAGSKQQPQWEAELMDPASKFIVSHVQGRRDQALIHQLLAAEP
jgi:transposase-like protein